MYRDPEGKASEKQPTICPTEYRCYIKEVFLYVCSGCGNDTVEKSFVLRATPRPGGT